jgi:hypothetical protein
MTLPYVMLARYNSRFMRDIVALAVAFCAISASAATTWQAPRNISSEADVLTNGTLLAAANFGDQSAFDVTVNGVLFPQLPLSGTQVSLGNLTLSASGGQDIGSPTGAGISEFYGAMLKAGLVTTGTVTLTVHNLSVGALYAIEIWANDTAGDFPTRWSTVITDGDAVSLALKTSHDPGGRGQYVIGTFNATGTSEAFQISAATSDPQLPAQAVVNAVQVRSLSAPVPTPGQTHLGNISTRGRVGIEDEVLIAGFIISGQEPKVVAVRALGPTLATFGVAGTLQDPSLSVFDHSGNQIGQNDNWISSVQAQRISDAGLQPPDAHEAVVLLTLLPGRYTAIVRGVNGSTGNALAEVYDVQ